MNSTVIVLNNPSDITDDVKKRIRDQTISELQINYPLASDGDVITNSPFANQTTLTEIKFSIILGEQCTSVEKMFFNCTALTTAPKLNLENVKNLNWMFEDCKSLTKVPDYNIENATSLKGMFHNCSSLAIFPKLITSKKIENIDCLGITQGCSSLTEVPKYKSPIIILNSSDDVTDIVRLRTGSLDLEEIVINFNVERKLMFGQFTQSNSPFSGLPNLKKIPFRIVVGSSCHSLNGLFFGCENLEIGPDLDTKSVNNMDSMFQGCSNLESIPKYNTENVTTMRNMFHGCTSLKTVPLLDTSKVQTVFGMFEGCKELLEIPKFNLESATDLSWFLSGCSKVSSIPKLNTKSAKFLCSMFNRCQNLINIPKFSLRHVQDLEKIFSGYPNEKVIEKFFGIFGRRKWIYKIKKLFKKKNKQKNILSHK